MKQNKKLCSSNVLEHAVRRRRTLNAVVEVEVEVEVFSHA
jgi:hypothetical protein